MEVCSNLRKFELLIEYVVDGKIQISEALEEKLVKFLEDRNENNLGKHILESPCFSDLIFRSLQNINNASVPIKTFLIKIVTILFKNELQFTKMQMQGFQTSPNKFCILSNLQNNPPPNLHLACIKLATTQVSHCSGLLIIIEHKLWTTILYKNIHKKSKQISTAVYNFMAKLVWKIIEHGQESHLLEVLEYIVEPIQASGYLNVSVMDTETDTALCDDIYSHLNALLAVIAEADNYSPVNSVMTLLKDYFIVDHRLYEIFRGTRNACLLKLLNSCLFRFCFAILRPILMRKETDDFCNKMAAFHRNYLVHAIQKREAFAVVDYVVQSNIIWSNFEKSHATEFNFPLTFERNGQKIEFSLQIIIHLIVPMLKYSAQYRFRNHLKMTDVVEQFLVKMGRTITDYIYSCCYMFAAMLDEGDNSYKNKVTTHTLKELLRLKGHINATQAGTVFQSLYYLLETYICVEEGQVVNDNPDQDDLRLLSHLLEAMKMIIKEHNIPWYENVEIVCIQADLLNLLNQHFLTTKQKIQILDLINICVQKFLSPNMSLLVETKSTNASTLNEIGEVVMLYAQHEDWELRDSAYNILNTCTDIAFVKYTPLQKVILDNHLFIFATKAALTDPDFYSQSTALKCLAAATKIDRIWQEVLLYSTHIYFLLVNLLRTHPEGMVRKEAVIVLTGIYSNQKTTPYFQDILHQVMMAAALDDLHWEVQLAALNFWKKTIDNHLTYRGMIGRRFPLVTFSKEKRKIIILNGREIQNQLKGVMNHLAQIGCLTVLVESMDELNNIRVMENAHYIAQDLIQILDEYKFEIPAVNIKVDETASIKLPLKKAMEEEILPMDLSSATSEEDRHKVIDSILNVDQVDLIVNLQKNYCKTKTEQMDIDFEYCSRKELVHPDKFLETFKNNNFSLIIENKKNCNSGCVSTLEALLDEVLNL